jgi:hypothetical protein
MPKYKVGDHVLVKLSGGRIVEATIKAVVEYDRGRALVGLVRRGNGTDLSVAGGSIGYLRLVLP